MKRVILSLTLALFMLGLVVPPISHATDSATSATSSRSSAADEITPARENETFPPKLAQRSLRPVVERYLIIASPLTGIIVIQIEGPSLSDTPPGKRLSDRRPEGDDNGWETDLK
ncbi:MAG: hypothetical protein KKG33_13360 [candidate division Zixibacteria bacterium]|nr:hypothetical protein [candidate division Zixibacteria bacterium]MBU1471510.1 hypothetical protein [candidate division Zixibacteria bacterium]MBU2626541.1 hypothetical protein [candidate division Zixibacteria bacterium]